MAFELGGYCDFNSSTLDVALDPCGCSASNSSMLDVTFDLGSCCASNSKTLDVAFDLGGCCASKSSRLDVAFDLGSCCAFNLIELDVAFDLGGCCASNSKSYKQLARPSRTATKLMIADSSITRASSTQHKQHIAIFVNRPPFPFIQIAAPGPPEAAMKQDSRLAHG